MSDAARLMDGIYAYQRHIYDATRKYYLLGRDRLIAELAPPPGGSVLEIGCGTARNLLVVARRYPSSACFGIDISQAMLATAARGVKRAGLEDRIRLVAGDATSFDAQALFGRPHFDRVMISYALSMIPCWRDVLDHASTVLAPGGSLHLVDFFDGRGLPSLFNNVLRRWLARFHVVPRADLPETIVRLGHELGLASATRPLHRGYALAGTLERR